MRSAANSKTNLSFSKRQVESIHRWLEEQASRYNHPSFITDDPISVPHRFTRLQDIEISGLLTAIMAWGQRKTIISNAHRLMQMMDDAPYDFVRHHQDTDRKRFESFCHRTLQSDDILYIVTVLQDYYVKEESLETAFAGPMGINDHDVYAALEGFHNMMFDQPWVLERTRKHIATPVRKSSCKRLNMYLRWMVRSDDRGVDFGLWKKITPAQLVIPLDVHVGNVARRLGLLRREANDWQAAKELTECLKQFDPADPVRYDFALFGAGIHQSKGSDDFWP